MGRDVGLTFDIAAVAGENADGRLKLRVFRQRLGRIQNTDGVMDRSLNFQNLNGRRGCDRDQQRRHETKNTDGEAHTNQTDKNMIAFTGFGMSTGWGQVRIATVWGDAGVGRGERDRWEG